MEVAMRRGGLGKTTVFLLLGLLGWLHGRQWAPVVGGVFGVGLGACYFIPSFRRLFGAFVYLYYCAFLMALMLTVTWARYPTGSPPLPDLFHDVLPSVSAFNAPFFTHTNRIEGHRLPELLIQIDVAIAVVFIAWQKNRTVIFRRIFTVYGSLMFLRCITIVVTSFPASLGKCSNFAPGHKHEWAQEWANLQVQDVVFKAVRLILPLGFPTLTCEDMVFGGHAMVLTLCGMVWHTYYPSVDRLSFNWVKILVWALTTAGLLAILTVRLHYTLDVLLDLFFTLAIWSSYHRLANDVIIGQQFVMVWLVDGLILYPGTRWLEQEEIHKFKQQRAQLRRRI